MNKVVDILQSLLSINLSPLTCARVSHQLVPLTTLTLTLVLTLADEQRVQFVGSLVGPFLEMTLVPEPELRRATLPIFFDMMQAEQQARGNFKQVGYAPMSIDHLIYYSIRLFIIISSFRLHVLITLFITWYVYRTGITYFCGILKIILTTKRSMSNFYPT